MLNIEDIIEIRKATKRTGYEIVFPNNQIIWLVKRRTIVAILLLIKHEYCSEADLAGANSRLQDLKKSVDKKINPVWIQDRYGDANKPFSELWTEEGFSCIYAEKIQGNRQYVLKKADHMQLFNENAKPFRKQLALEEKSQILLKQNGKCNICGAVLREKVLPHTFSKDRVRMEFDHRKPIDRGGGSSLENYQALCHYCNKSKRQMCFVCGLENCSPKCALVNPEVQNIVQSTMENVCDRITKRN
ncbi:MAG: HNH endonuclease [Defluviitaleaceae bacterium]|nr:HNH endonuclease [Defluviitaleaceae bacterium]